MSRQIEPIKRYHFSIGGRGVAPGALGLRGVIESRSDDVALAGLQRILHRLEGHAVHVGWFDNARADCIAIYTNAMIATMAMFDEITVLDADGNVR